MKRLLLVLSLLGVAAPASADVVMPPPRVRVPSTTIHLASVRRVTTDAPTSDAEAVLREARAELGTRTSRINQCLRGLDLREDPLRNRRRSLTGRLVFTRSGRPTVQIDSVRGLPDAARACVEEAVRSLAVRTAPRGRVEIRFTYTLR